MTLIMNVPPNPEFRLPGKTDVRRPSNGRTKALELHAQCALFNHPGSAMPLYRAIGKQGFFAWGYGDPQPVRETLDEEGCGAVICAAAIILGAHGG